MRQIVYKCDTCKVEIGDKKHISLTTGRFSGIAIPPKNTEFGNWSVVGAIGNSFFHFCNSVCLKKFFEALYSKAK